MIHNRGSFINTAAIRDRLARDWGTDHLNDELFGLKAEEIEADEDAHDKHIRKGAYRATRKKEIASKLAKEFSEAMTKATVDGLSGATTFQSSDEETPVSQPPQRSVWDRFVRRFTTKGD